MGCEVSLRSKRLQVADRRSPTPLRQVLRQRRKRSLRLPGELPSQRPSGRRLPIPPRSPASTCLPAMRRRQRTWLRPKPTVCIRAAVSPSRPRLTLLRRRQPSHRAMHSAPKPSLLNPRSRLRRRRLIRFRELRPSHHRRPPSQRHRLRIPSLRRRWIPQR